MDNKNIILLILSTIIIISFLTNISSASIDCSACHTTEPGKSSIKAKGTIEIGPDTCLKCHNPNFPPVPIGYNTHLVHIGKYSAKVDFLSRHPEATKSLDCSNCHKLIFDCRNCHVNGIPHVQPPLGYNCKGCHGEIDKLFKHPTINLKIHNIFNISLNTTTACTMCHNPDNMRSLKLASGEIVSIDGSHRLCYQCHTPIFKLWDAGKHFSNKTLPTDQIFSEDPATRQEWEENWKKENTCVNCHNPHNPSELYMLPGLAGPAESTSLAIFIYIIPVILLVIIFILARHYKIDLKLVILKLSSLKKISLPKLSLPISISLEEEPKIKKEQTKKEQTKPKFDDLDKKLTSLIGTTDTEKKEENIDKENITKDNITKEDNIIQSENKENITKDNITKEDNIIQSENITKDNENKIGESYTFAEETETKPKGKKKWLNRGDISFILAIFIMFGTFYAVFGTFMPMSVAISESMSPHIEKGDLLFFTDISRVDNIKMYSTEKNKNGYKSLENYGDVIIYKPFGKDEAVPIIHRAMYYVSEGDEMWPDGPKAPHDGYITKGDNLITNSNYDQQVSTSLNQPVKKEWIVGIARFRVPYIGRIRMLLPI